MKYINKIMCLALILGTLISCDDYLDVNNDPNNPLLVDVAPDLMMAGAQGTTGSVFGVRMNRMGNALAGAWGGNVLQFADPFGTEFRFDITTTFYDDIWDDLYRRTSNYTNIINYSGAGDYTNHKAIAKILNAFYFQYLVDMYGGDIPYFGKHQYTEQLQVAYDDDALIYADLLEEVNEAIDLIDNGSADAISVGSEDAIYAGDMTMWRKFANTLKLRLVLRQSNVISDTDAQNMLAGITASDCIGLNEDAALNPGYVQETDRQNPFYENFGYSVDGNLERNRFVTATKFAIEMLDGTLSGSNDDRISSMFRTNAAGNYVGIEQGQILGDLTPAEAGDGFSLLGSGYGVDQFSAANAQRSLPILTAAESLFLQAEAITRGYMSGDANTAFDTGVQASFAYLGAANYSGYLTDINGVVGFDYTGSTENQIEAIINQKWLALYSINGAEMWIEMNRTGYPNAPLPINQNNTTRAVKLLYPLSEIQGNSANVPASQTTADAFINTVFWN